MRILVLGAGVVGVAAAWYLAEAGHEVTVVDRKAAPGLETSYANGGQISVSHAEPWANPTAPFKVLRWLGREDSPLLWRLRADPAQWAWGLRFLAECWTWRTRNNIRAIVDLALESRNRLASLRAGLNLDYDCLTRGILHVYSDTTEFEHALPQAALMREFGCERVPKTPAECLAIEPALVDSRLPIVGGTYTAADESGDAHKFTCELARHCVLRGVSFVHGAELRGLLAASGRIAGVRLADGAALGADAFVVALGSYSPLLLRPLGLHLPLVPAKGYSVTLPLREGAMAPTVSITDDGAKIVLSRLGQRLRVAGTAEFAGYDTSINQQRCETIARRALEWFPGVGGTEEMEFWAGLRPATPGNVPFIGRVAGYENLYLNTGHGTLGWTMACGSGKLLADLVSSRAPAIDPAPYSV